MKAKEKTLNQTHKFVKKIYEKMAATNKTLVFSAAVHGFHVYGDVWNPHKNEELVGLFEKNNLFDLFANRTCRKDYEKTERDFPPNKTLIDKGGKITAKLSSTHYRRSPLFQTGLEIPCEVTVTIPANIKGHFLMQRSE